MLSIRLLIYVCATCFHCFFLKKYIFTVASVLTESNTDVSKILVHWINSIYNTDPTGIFEINPKETSIPPNNSVLLECVFKPKESDAFYDSTMSGRVYWNDKKNEDEQEEKRDEMEVVVVPMCVYLRLMGSTFAAGKAWIPQLRYPDKVIIRPALPNTETHDSFEMKLTGYLPVSYRFIPPKNSRFLVKPNQGVVLDNEFIIVQFFANDLDGKGAVERWTLILNGRENLCHFIFFSSYAENPKILVNKDNKIRFDNVLPGCEDIKTVVLKNISVHPLTFRLLIDDKKALQFDREEGRIDANEEITLECTATASDKMNQCETEVNIELRKLVVTAVTGPPFYMTVRAKIRGIYSQLCAIPSSTNLGTVRVNQLVTTDFDVFNFGESLICFKLVQHSEDRLAPTKYLTFNPKGGTVRPGESLKLTISVKCDESGEFKFDICYKVMLHPKSKRMLQTKPTCLIKVTVKVEYPTLQVIGISDYTHGECFSKASLWKLLNINKLNSELKSIKADENRTVEMYLPDSEMSDEPFSTTLILQNKSSFDAEAKLKRNKICDCPMVRIDKSISFRSKAYECRHKDLFKANFSGNNFKPEECQSLKLTINYNCTENVTMSYFMQLSDGRTLILYFYFNILAPEVDFPSRYYTGNTLYLPPVGLLERDPPYTPLFFYNQSSNNVQIGLNEVKPDNSRYDRKFEIMRCLNPDLIKISPYKIYALMFRLVPIECKKYSATFDLILGKDHQKLHVSATGIPDTSSEQSCYEISASKTCISGPDITYSKDYIKVKTILSWSCTEVIVFVTNNTDDLIGYSMKRSWLEGVVSISAPNNKGTLKPKEIKAIVIYIETFDAPLKIHQNLIGKFLNHTAYYRHKKTQLEHSIVQEMVKDEFTISEKGEEFTVNDIVVEPMPKNFFRTLTFELTNISIFDVDLHMDADEQLKQSPQFLLELNADKILKILIPEKPIDELPVPTVANRLKKKQQGDSADEESVTQRCLSSSDCPNIPVLKNTIECLLMTALESKLFKKSLQLHQQSDPPYYVQFQVGDEIHYQKADTNKMATVKEELNPCQGPTVAAIFRNLLSDGLYEYMHLGPSMATKSERDLVYDKKFKSQYTV